MKAGIERELASRADQRVLRWFGHVERMDAYCIYGQKGVDGRRQWGTGTMETEVRHNRWCEGGFRQQRNDGGGCATMRERSERVESPGTYLTESVCLALCSFGPPSRALVVITWRAEGCRYMNRLG